MDRDELGEYVERSEIITDESPQMDEANTKKRLVEPFVEDVLRWNGFSDVELEYSVQMGRNPKKVDYALLLEDTPVVFVEAKGLDENLTETEENQLRSYMRQVGVDLGVLTNGKRFVFLKREKGADRPSEITFGDLRLGELTDNEDVLRAVSKGLVESNESDVIIEGIRRRRAAVSTLRDEKDEVAEEVVGVITEHVDGSVTSVAETEAKEFVDRVVEELENGGVETKNPDRKDENTRTVEEDSPDILFTENGNSIASFGGDTQADAMAKAVGYLINEHDLLDKISLPHVPGKKKAVLNDRPEDAEGEDMRGCREIADGYFLDTHMNRRQKEDRTKELAERCGLGVEFNW